MTIPIIGIDAEWQTNPDEESVSVLSYQWFGLDEDREWSGIHYPDLEQSERSKRLTISQWVSLALQQGYRRSPEKRIQYTNQTEEITVARYEFTLDFVSEPHSKHT
tara:strand:+ start:139 stop:456 length:318 start_codon:yes stop_codon:yes gene_type:complete